MDYLMQSPCKCCPDNWRIVMLNIKWLLPYQFHFCSSRFSSSVWEKWNKNNKNKFINNTKKKQQEWIREFKQFDLTCAIMYYAHLTLNQKKSFILLFFVVVVECLGCCCVYLFIWISHLPCNIVSTVTHRVILML